MLLNTPLFLVFLTAVCLLYWWINSPAGRKALLLLASYGFYAALDPRFVIVLIGMTAATYGIGRVLPQSLHPRRWILLGVLLNLGALAYFKYAGFFLANLGPGFNSSGAGRPASLQILLPIGISFYAFQAIAYLLEVSRGHLPPVTNGVDFALYLAYFPKLIAGPFVRPADFFRRLAELPKAIAREEVRSALGLLLLGLFKKVVIADSIAALADVSFRAAASPNAGGFPAPLYIAGFYLFAVQIYADFSGYTDLARGSSALLGIPLPENFRSPYFSVSPADFWNRWHMTLTAWFREYLFFPLSRWGMTATGRRSARAIQSAATVITMALVGLWHGAAWTFVGWGIWHGALLVLDQQVKLNPTRRVSKFLAGLLTFHLVGLGWIVFRAPSLAVAGRFFSGMLSLNQMAWSAQFLPPALLALALILGLDAARALAPRFPRGAQVLRPAAIAAAVTVLAGLWLLQGVSQSGAAPFIYGAF
jgi:alginate O-acetyltransferase complex protein AlgI